MVKDVVEKCVYRVLRKYEGQLENIKEDPCRLKMKENLFNKIGQVLFLHFDKWRSKGCGFQVCEDTKLREIKYAEKYIGEMATNSAIELTKPFGFDYLTETYLRDYLLIRKQIMSRLPLGSDILDLGCGGGWLAIFLSYEGYNVDGVELPPLLVDMAQKRYNSWHSTGKCNFIAEDMESMELNKRYDLVMMYEALHHTDIPENAIRNAARHCKNNGYLLLKEPNLIWSITGIRSAFINDNRERGFTKMYLKKLLRENGFKDIRSFKNRFGFLLRDIYVLARKP